MSRDGEQQGLVCRSYTFARRYPLVVGKVGGATLWWRLTIPQVVVLVSALVALLTTRRWWAHLGALGNLAVAAGLPAALAWLVRRVRIEGRSPLRAAMGALGYLSAAAGARWGRVQGRPARRPRPLRMASARVFVSELPAAQVAEDPKRRRAR